MSSEQRLAAAKLDFQMVFESMPEIGAILSVPDYIIVAVTNRYVRVSGKTREQLIGLKITVAFPNQPEVPQSLTTARILRSLNQALRTKRPHNLGVFRYDLPDMQNPDGPLVEHWWRATSTPICDLSNMVQYVLLTSEDVNRVIDGLVELETAASALSKTKRSNKTLASS